MLDTDPSVAARQLAEQALDSYAKGDTAEGDRLADQAAATDRGAVDALVAEIDEDATADHTTAVAPPEEGDEAAEEEAAEDLEDEDEDDLDDDDLDDEDDEDLDDEDEDEDEVEEIEGEPAKAR